MPEGNGDRQPEFYLGIQMLERHGQITGIMKAQIDQLVDRYSERRTATSATSGVGVPGTKPASNPPATGEG